MAETVVSAYQNKYEDDDSLDCEEIQMVFVKRTRYKPLNIVLDNCNISSLGSAKQLSEICSKATDCDLSHNKIDDWNNVFKLLDTGRKISFLSLSNNLLGSWTTLPPSGFPALSVLVLCGNSISWDNLYQLLPQFPSLKNLNIGSNEVRSLKCPRIPGLPNLKELNLINNKLERFEDALEIGDVFPGIETLVLSDNPLCSFGDNEELVRKFGELKKLHVNNITINSWDEVSKLRWFPKLNDVRMVHWDLFGDMNADERLKMLGALLPNTPKINGAELPDRDAAERWYLRRCQAAGETDGLRYSELHEKYGVLPELGEITLGGKNETITITVTVPDRGVELKREVSVYDTYKQLVISVEKEIKEALSLNIITLLKPGFALKAENKVALKVKAETENNNNRCHKVRTAVEIDAISGSLRVRVLDVNVSQMLYKTLAWVLPQVNAEDGDVIEFKPATAFEIRYDAAHGPYGHTREFLAKC